MSPIDRRSAACSDHAGKAHARHLDRARLEQPQRAEHGAGHQQRQADRQRQHHRDRATVTQRPGAGGGLDRLAAGHRVVAEVLLDLMQQVQLGAGHRPPLGRVDVRFGAAVAVQHRGLQLLGALHLRPDEGVDEGVALRVGGGRLELRQHHVAGGQPGGEGLVVPRDEPAPRQHAEDQVPLGRDQLLDTRDADERADALCQLAVADPGGDLAVGVDQVRDGGAVEVERPGRRQGVVVDVAPQPRQPVQLVARGGQLADGRRREHRRIEAVGAGAVGRQGAVGRRALGRQGAGVDRPSASAEQEAVGQPTLGLQRIHQGGAAQRELGQAGHLAGLAAGRHA